MGIETNQTKLTTEQTAEEQVSLVQQRKHTERTSLKTVSITETTPIPT